MDLDELGELIDRRWTAGELVEFLGISVEDILRTFPARAKRNLDAILEELGYEYEDDETEL
jgi:hypothetical protein